MSSLLAIGLNHKSAPLQVRERLSFQHGRAKALLEALSDACGGENLLLCTCNRTEIYHCGEADKSALISLLAHKAGLDTSDDLPQSLEDYFYCHHEQEAVQHLFRVAAGLDSMVVGEYEILGQIKQSLAAAGAAKTIGPTLTRLFQDSLAAGKRVRTETKISQGVFSVGGCAVVLARAIFGDLAGASVLVVGAGEMAEAVARHLLSNGARSILVANRTHERAVQLADSLEGEAIHFDNLPSALEKCHILISSTAAPHPIITKPMVAAAMRARRNRPLFLIDIAVPRDIEPESGGLDNVYLYNIDDLSAVVKRDSQERLKEGEKAEHIIREHAHQFLAWQSSRAALPTLRALQEKLDAIRSQELQEALRRLSHLSPSDKECVEQFSRAMVNKILHAPISHLRNGAAEQQSVVEALRHLFELEESRE